jgi:hypothetical protein
VHTYICGQIIKNLAWRVEYSTKSSWFSLHSIPAAKNGPKAILSILDNLCIMDRERPSRSKVKKVYERDDYRCQNCGRKGGNSGETVLHAHHIVPLKDGGSNNISNMKTLCGDCHEAIHTDKTAPTAQQDIASESELSDLAFGSVALLLSHPAIVPGICIFGAIIWLYLGNLLISAGMALLGVIWFYFFAIKIPDETGKSPYSFD